MFRRISPRIISSFGNGAGGTPRFRLCAPDEKVNMEKMNAVNLEKMYEVLKFVEYGGYCRRSMDCVHGMLLIDRMKNEAVVDKAVLFGWFRKMAVCAEQYERCGEGQNYKYLNPYGIVLSDEGEVLFLDTESRENAEVMKQMQKRAVRSHFIRPVYEMDTCGSREPDLFGYGNTLRFMLAYMKVVPALTKREEIRLFRICGKCIGETRKKYSSFLQVLKELPTVRNKTEKTDKKRVGVWSGIAAGAAGCILAAVYMGDAHTDLAVSNGEKITGEDIKTDTGTDILDKEAKKLGIELVAIRSNFTDTVFSENTEAEFTRFYDKLRQTDTLPVSSQPSPAEFLELFEDAKEKEEEVVVITISSKLSGTYNGAMLAKDMAEYDNIYVVDSLLASLSERLLVEYAVKLRDAGMGAKELVRKLEQDRERVILTGVPSTLLYLKMGGRISPVVAAVGGVIGIKPVLWLKDGVIESRSKARGMRMAKSGMQSFLKDYEADPAMPVMFAHSDNAEMGQQFMEETVQQFGLTGCSLHEIGMAIGTHIGPDALMMAFMRK